MHQWLRLAVRRVAQPVRSRIAGPEYRAEVNERLSGMLRLHAPEPELIPAYSELGLPLAAIVSACTDYGLDALAQRISARGSSAGHLHQIARHGSALADIGCPPDLPDRDQLLLDAALFNLAVALTDSLVDDDLAAGVRAGRAMSPEVVRRRLAAPDDPTVEIGPVDDDLGSLYALCDALLVRLGKRFAGNGARLEQLGTMLERMHHAEFASGADRVPAKVLPIAFIGTLVDDGSSPYIHELYDELGALIGLADDWEDLASDMRRMRANQLILARDRTLHHRVEYAVRCAYRLALPGRLAEEVVSALSERAARVLSIARAISPASHAKTASVLGVVLGC